MHEFITPKYKPQAFYNRYGKVKPSEDITGSVQVLSECWDHAIESLMYNFSYSTCALTQPKKGDSQ